LSFKDNFNKTNPRFLEILLRKYPSLTQREISICMYLKLNYSSADISKELDITLASVDTYRYNIRKKMGVERKVSLVSHLNTID
jgi:AraC family chitin signaling transcriptional activator